LNNKKSTQRCVVAFQTFTLSVSFFPWYAQVRSSQEYECSDEPTVLSKEPAAVSLEARAYGLCWYELERGVDEPRALAITLAPNTAGGELCATGDSEAR
jgi:hypothetical protein